MQRVRRVAGKIVGREQPWLATKAACACERVNASKLWKKEARVEAESGTLAVAAMATTAAAAARQRTDMIVDIDVRQATRTKRRGTIPHTMLISMLVVGGVVVVVRSIGAAAAHATPTLSPRTAAAVAV